MGAQTYLPIEILDYVETHAPGDDSPLGISQRELAKVLGYHPCSMSRPLHELVSEGFLAVRRSRVRDGVRKQLTYHVTETGRSRLRRETREVPLPAGEMPPSPHPFLGRKEELTRLSEISHSGGSVIFVDGAPGMGKTTLVARHLRRAKRGRIPFWFTIRASTSPRQFVSALSHTFAAQGGQQLAYYAQLPRPPVPGEAADLISRAVGARTLMVVIDDAQNAGPDMQKFLRELVSGLLRGHDHQFIFIGQDPPFFAPPGVQNHRISIGGLDRAAAHDLTDRSGGLAERFETIYQSTLGSPLLLQLAVSNPDVEADAASLPIAVVKRLDDEEVRAVLPVALANEPLPATFVTDEGGLSADRVMELTKMGILHRTLQGRVEILQVVRGAILTRVAPADEHDAHRRLAKFYSRSRRPESLRERFLHLVDGQDWKTAAHLLAQQGRLILRLGYSEALRSAHRHLATMLPRGTARVRVLESESRLLRAHSDYSEAIVSLRRAVADSADDPRSQCENLLGLVDLHLRRRDLDQARTDFEVARKIGPMTRRLGAYFDLTEGRLAEAQSNNRLAQERYEAAFNAAHRARSTELALESIAAWSSLEERQTGEGTIRLVAEALPEARQANRPDLVFNLLLVRARAYIRTGKQQLAETDLREIRADAEALGYVNQLAHALSGLATIAGSAERWREAIGYAEQVNSIAERVGNDLLLGHTLGQLCALETRLALKENNESLIDSAIQHGQMGVEVLGRIAPTDSLGLTHSYLSEAFVRTRNGAKAVEHYRLAMTVATQLDLAWLRDILTNDVYNQIRNLDPKLVLDQSAPASAT
jgi:DNA-binding MarR family transcriptional regulator